MHAGYGGHEGATNEQISLAGLLNLGSPRNLLGGHTQNMPGGVSAPVSSGLSHLFNQELASRLQAGGATGNMEPGTLHSNAIPSPRNSGEHCSAIGGVNIGQHSITGLPQTLRDDSAMQFDGYGPPEGVQQGRDQHPVGIPGCDHDDLAKLAQLYHPSSSGGQSSLDGGRQLWGGVGDSGAQNGPLDGTHSLSGNGAPPQRNAAVSTGHVGDVPETEGMWSLAATDVQDLLMRFQTPRDMDVGGAEGRVHRGSDGRVSGSGDRGAAATAQFLMPHVASQSGRLGSGQEDHGNRSMSQSGVATSDVDIPSAPSAGGEDDLTQFLQAQT